MPASWIDFVVEADKPFFIEPLFTRDPRLISPMHVLMAMMAIRIFAAGVIATDERHGRESILTTDTSLAEEERKARAVFDAIGAGHGTRAQVALRFVLSNPDISCAIVGMAELPHLDEALQAQAMGPLPADVLAKLDTLYASDFGRVK